MIEFTTSSVKEIVCKVVGHKFDYFIDKGEDTGYTTPTGYALWLPDNVAHCSRCNTFVGKGCGQVSGLPEIILRKD